MVARKSGYKKKARRKKARARKKSVARKKARARKKSAGRKKARARKKSAHRKKAGGKKWVLFNRASDSATAMGRAAYRGEVSIRDTVKPPKGSA